ncbi:hypothetical protein C6P40_001315 [Pichia californica]|uniref:Alpha-1,2-mannosyltransferase n=1 Tax=Pichia californica TaxID=460514 RepID=A0A9P6WJN2_9ASCO|nr:hypothetical protein C6P40_001315 [[Candida] californica]
MLVLKRLKSKLKNRPILFLTLGFIFIYSIVFITSDKAVESHSTALSAAISKLSGSSSSSSSSNYGVYSELFNLLARSKPDLDPLKNYKSDNKVLQKFVSDKTSFTKDFLENLQPLTDSEKKSIIDSYNSFVNNISLLNMKTFGRDDDNNDVKGKGIVMVGGYKFSWLSLFNIHQLRKQGSKLPVEVYIPDIKEFDEKFCNKILPELNARCILGYKELPLNEFNDTFNSKRYEYKILAILTSSFEDVLLLDADNIVIDNPDRLFNWDIYKKNNLIFWPDSWQRTTNPFIFDLVNLKIDYSNVKDMNDYNVHDLPGAIPNPSTESGMIMVNKRKQLKTLLIALYFNIYGFDYYYPLITQGGAGQGDKDTYIIAAYGANAPYYQIQQPVSFLGHFNKDNEFNAGALGQCDPMTSDEKYAYDNKIKDKSCSNYLFLHLSFPKLYPNEIGNKVQNKYEGHFLQFDGIKWPYDIELQIWEIMCQLLCKTYKKNSLQPKNPASSILDSKFKLSGNDLKFIKDIEIEKQCTKKLIPHLEYLRSFFKYADKSKGQFQQDWPGKSELNSNIYVDEDYEI